MHKTPHLQISCGAFRRRGESPAALKGPLDHKPAGVPRFQPRIFFTNIVNTGKKRPALQRVAQLGQLSRSAVREHLDAPIVQISGEAADTELVGFPLCEYPVAYTLHAPGDQKALG